MKSNDLMFMYSLNDTTDEKRDLGMRTQIL
jgi:hypothetical protein